jgi:hypothetical protein
MLYMYKVCRQDVEKHQTQQEEPDIRAVCQHHCQLAHNLISGCPASADSASAVATGLTATVILLYIHATDIG